MKKFIAISAIAASCAALLPSAFARETVPGNQGVSRLQKVEQISRRSLMENTARKKHEKNSRRGMRNKSFATDKASSSGSSVSSSSSSSSSAQ